MADILELLNLFGDSVSPLLEEFISGVGGVLSKLKFVRYTGSQSEPSPDQKYKSITLFSIQEVANITTFKSTFITHDGSLHVLTGSRSWKSGKNATISLDGIVVSDLQSEITYKEHPLQKSLQVDFKFGNNDYRFDAYL